LQDDRERAKTGGRLMADVTRVSTERLRQFIEQVFAAAGAPAADAATVAEVLVKADLRGFESHGSTRVAGYLSMIRLGLLNPKSVGNMKRLPAAGGPVNVT
jgi:LDH2 family malate/lactate/ureidoglycolate dehydrogenase